MSHRQILIPLEEAFDLARQKPRRKTASEQFVKVTRRYWLDFTAFLRDRYRLQFLHQVKRQHAEAYISYIRSYGRWDRVVRYREENCPQRPFFRNYQTGDILSASTLNRYQAVCKAVFTALLPDLGKKENPFSLIFPLPKAAIGREIFTSFELRKIFTAPPPLMRGLFTIGIYTGLRLGDVATLRWAEIDAEKNSNFRGGEIRRRTRKTGNTVEIPVVNELADFLSEQHQKYPDETFVLPEAAKLYLEHQNVLNRKIHAFLHSLGIQTSIVVPGRKRRQSVKDFHSLRHTFCYYAGMRGIPLFVVQRIVGHLSPEMTRHYQDHADREARIEAMRKMDHLTRFTSAPKKEESLRRNLFSYIREAPPETLAELWRKIQ